MANKPTLGFSVSCNKLGIPCIPKNTEQLISTESDSSSMLHWNTNKFMN